MIEVQNVTKRYGQTLAVNDVSFRVEQGEIVGFLGPNAAGKTTTMRIITNYMPATSGTVKVAGYDVFDDSLEVKKRIGYLPENPPLYLDMNVEDYLRFAASIKGVKKNDIPKRIEKVIEQAALDGMRDRMIKKLSKGYRQRVGIAQALIHDPEVLILDEPTVGLDPKQIIEVRELIKSLGGERTIILSTHILPEVSMSTERVVIINKGQIVAEDTPSNLIASMKSGETIRVLVEAPFDEVREKLQNVSGVAAVTVEPEIQEEGITGLRVESNAGYDVRKDIASAIVQNNWGLLELSQLDMTLEDIFLELTTEEEEVQA